MFSWYLAAHVLGLLLWVAGVFGAGRVMIDHVRAGAQGAIFTATERRLLFFSGHAGMAITIVFGFLALTNNPAYYLSQWFFRAKLVAVAFAVAATIVLTAASQRLAQAQPTVGERAIQLWRGLFMAAVAAAVILIFPKPI